MFICNFCNKEFKSKSNLNTHVKNAKYCLNQRIDSKIIDNFCCEHCDKKYTTKQCLVQHYNNCFNYKIYIKEQEFELLTIDKDNKIKELQSQIKLQSDEYKIQIKDIQDTYKAQIKDLQDRLERICSKAIDKPTTINNNKEFNTSNNVFNSIGYVNLTPDYIEKTFQEKLTLEQVYKGQEGIAELCYEHLLKDNNQQPIAFCTDKARQVIKYKNENNMVIKDHKAFNLVHKIYDASEKAALKLKDQFMDKIYNNQNYNPSTIKIEEIKDESFGKKINKKTELKLIRLLCEKLGIKMDKTRSIFYLENEEDKEIFWKRFQKLKAISLYQTKLWKPRDIPNDEIIKKIIKENPELKEDDYSDYETDYEEIFDEEEREFEEERIKNNIESLKNELDENVIIEKVGNLKKSIEDNSWTKEKKDYYLNTLVNGIGDIQLMKMNPNKFSKFLTLKLPSEM
jgi:hypothetical protein